MEHKVTRYIPIIVIALGFFSCKKDSTFIPDSSDNLLPKYTENGYNIAGALINDTAWRSEFYNCTNYCPLSKLFGISSFVKGDSTIFHLSGAYTPNSIKYIDSSLNNVTKGFVFVIKGLKIETQDSLLKLNNKTFQLDSVNSYVSIAKFYPLYNFKKGKGTFTVSRVQKDSRSTIGDGSSNNPLTYRYTVSGLFNFQANDDRFYDIKDGRFDMEVYLNQNLSIQ